MRNHLFGYITNLLRKSLLLRFDFLCYLPFCCLVVANYSHEDDGGRIAYGEANIRDLYFLLVDTSFVSAPALCFSLVAAHCHSWYSIACVANSWELVTANYWQDGGEVNPVDYGLPCVLGGCVCEGNWGLSPPQVSALESVYMAKVPVVGLYIVYPWSARQLHHNFSWLFSLSRIHSL